MADITTVVNAFNTSQAATANVVANTQFTQSYGNVSVADGMANVLCITSFGSGLLTDLVYTWNGNGFYFKCVPAPVTAGATEQRTQLAIAQGSSTSKSIRMMFDIELVSGNITANLFNVDNTFVDAGGAVTEKYDANKHLWLGWYYTGGILYFVKSPDGSTWTIMRQIAVPTWVTTMTNLTFTVQPNRTGGSNNFALIDNVNTNGIAPSAFGGVPFLQNVPAYVAAFPNARLLVEFAPGANQLNADTTWTWYDISAFVFLSTGLDITPMGRSDAIAQSQPAGLSLTLDNRTGAFSYGPQNATYGNTIRQNVPIRVSISLTGLVADKSIRFQGFVFQFNPEWNATTKYATVSVRAAGVFRRLQHGTTPLKSPMTRSISTDAVVKAYWPMEDKTSTAYLSSGLVQGQPMYYNNITLAGTDPGVNFPGSDNLPTFAANSSLQAQISGSFSNNWQVDIFHFVPARPAADTAMLRIHGIAGSTAIRWELVIPASGTRTITLTAYDESGALLVNTGATLIEITNAWVQTRLMVQQSGGNVVWKLVQFPANIGQFGVSITNNFVGTIGQLSGVSLLPQVGMANVAMGQIAVYNVFDHTNDDDAQIGYQDDYPSDRIFRLAVQNGVHASIQTSTADAMGFQEVDTLVDLLRDAEEVEGGIMYDGQFNGFKYVSRQTILNQSVKATFDASLGQIVPPLDAQLDDQGIVNKWTVSRSGGGTVIYQRTDGNLSVSSILNYEDSATVNTVGDAQLIDYAGWYTNLGTVEGYRYPEVQIDFRRVATQASNWLALAPGGRIAITNISAFLSASHPLPTVDLIVYGWHEHLSNMEWSVTANCGPYQPWRVMELGSATGAGDTEFVGHFDTGDGASTTTAAVAVGAVTIPITTAATKSGIWTVATADFPLLFDVNGVQVTVSGITTGTTPAQTLACSAVTIAIPSASVVKLWQTPVMEL